MGDKGKKTKARRNNRKRPSLIQSKNENRKKKRRNKYPSTFTETSAFDAPRAASEREIPSPPRPATSRPTAMRAYQAQRAVRAIIARRPATAAIRPAP